MRLRKAPRTALAAAVIFSAFAFAATALANHDREYVDDQTYSYGNWIWWRTGVDWSHSDSLHFQGYAASGGSPSAGGMFDELYINDWAGASCDNGLTWPYSSSNYTSLLNSSFIEINTDSVFMPSCFSSPKYRSSSYHTWDDGTWGSGKSQTWNQ